MRYQQTITVDAHQVAFSDKEKESASKGIPTGSAAGPVRHDSFSNLFSALIHKLGRHANEGDWVVTNADGSQKIVSDEVFQKTYTAVPEEAPAEQPAETAPELSTDLPNTTEAPSAADGSTSVETPVPVVEMPEAGELIAVTDAVKTEAPFPTVAETPELEAAAAVEQPATVATEPPPSQNGVSHE